MYNLCVHRYGFQQKYHIFKVTYYYLLTLKTTKPTWRAGRVIYKLTTSFDECRACQLVGRGVNLLMLRWVHG
ncbi:hypothetical protein C1H46_030709 [Malus baccata]|uniref:Uncharacterized protein n=1 Tax=Malus baccata TaxID=106549 RepID=A0A540LBW4_MALBA|nr:hypothetical protein C1H46_030709 [Malus baccata]